MRPGQAPPMGIPQAIPIQALLPPPDFERMFLLVLIKSLLDNLVQNDNDKKRFLMQVARQVGMLGMQDILAKKAEFMKVSPTSFIEAGHLEQDYAQILDSGTKGLVNQFVGEEVFVDGDGQSILPKMKNGANNEKGSKEECAKGSSCCKAQGNAPCCEGEAHSCDQGAQDANDSSEGGLILLDG